MNKKLVTLILFAILISIQTIAQKGTLRGKIIDESNGETLIGATVIVNGTIIGVSTDFDGNYSLPLDPGTYNIKISFISYEEQLFENVVIKSDEVTILNTSMGEAKLEIQEAVVTARARQRTETALQVLQKKSPKLMDGISSQQITRLGDSNAAQALKRVTGVSVQGGKYVLVRGLGDRYTITTLNGAEIPALDPEKNSVQMDIFPSNIIENIIVNKTFSPDMPGESTGGQVDIITKDFPEKFTFQISTSFGYNPQASLNSDFLSYNGGGTDWLGMDDGTRGIPDQAQKALDVMVQNDLGGLTSTHFTDQEISNITQSFSSEMEPTKKQSFLDHSHKISIGDQTNLFGKAFGYNMALSYSRNFKYYDDGIYAQNEESNVYSPNREVAESKGTENVVLSGLLNVNYKLSNKHKLGLRYVGSQSGSTTTRYREGPFYYEDPSGELYTQDRQLGYIERSFGSYQLSGKHVFPSMNKAIIEWMGAYTRMIQDEPDLRFFENLYNTQTNYFYIKTNDVPVRFFRELYENNYFGKLDFELPFNLFSRGAKLKLGGLYSYKERDLDETSFEVSVTNQEIPPLGANYFLENYFISPTNPGGYQYDVDRINNLINSYTAIQSVIAAYGMLDFKAGEKTRIVAGARLETTDIEYKNKQPNKEDATYRESTFDNLDVLPSLNITYSVSDKMNLRLAATQTIARPKFREIGTSYYNYKTGMKTYGNDSLLRSLVTNIDLRWEWFFRTGEKVSISGFYKNFNDPIVLKALQDANNLELKYFNGESSNLFGIEIELRKKLDFISFLKDFSVGGNFTFIHSYVVLTDKEAIDRELDPTKDHTRPMYGQAPYIINAYLGYTNTKMGLNANLGYNVAGEKLFLITQGTTPYIYEQPKPSLNFTLDKKLGKNFSVNVAVKNILDAEYDAVYHFDDGDKSFLNYSEGRTFKIGIKYLIN